MTPYEHYCQWCWSLDINPAPFEVYDKVVDSIR
jgi:hypothetical protein